MSIRYTLRHNIPADKLAAEDVNDSSTWDLDLLRKHELAETDDYDVVYRQHDGKVVSWAEAATQQSQAILEEVQGISADIDEQIQAVEAELEEVEATAETLTQEAEEANEAAQEALAQAQAAVEDSQRNAEFSIESANLAKDWARKMDGKVEEEEEEIDYSSKYYAQLSASSASSASTSAATATSAKNTAVSAKDDAITAKNSAESSATSASQSATSASTSATTATNKAGEAVDSAATASTKASEASTSATNAATSATSAANSATAASGSATSAAASETNAGLSATSAATSATNASASATSASTYADNALAAKTAAEDARDDIQAYYGIPIGYEYFSMNPNIPQGSLPLFGGEYSRATYSDLWAWVQTQTGYLKTEAEWQTLSASNNGNVPYYSDGDGSTTFRVPSLKCWVRGANGTVSEVGSYLAAGLPNITGSLDILYATNNVAIIRATTGAFSSPASVVHENSAFLQTGSSSTNIRYKQPLDASKSNAIYGNSTTVQPESIVGLWLVKAYGVIVDTGSIDEQAYIDDRFNASKQYTDDSIAVVDSEISAVNTRLGTILEASGNATAVSENTTLCSITTHPAGVFLITSFMDVNYNGSGVYTNKIFPAVHTGIATRNISSGGGGNCAVLLTVLNENEVVELQGYQAQSGTMRGRLKMVQLA